MRGSAAFGGRRRWRRRIDRATALDAPRFRRLLLVLGHPLLEAFDALGDIPHHVGEAALAEQQQDDDADDEPMPEAKTTHFNSPITLETVPSPPRAPFPAPAGQSFPARHRWDRWDPPPPH